MTRDDFAALALGNGARLPAPSRAASLQRNTTYRDQTMLLVSECSVPVLMLVVDVCSAATSSVVVADSSPRVTAIERKALRKHTDV